MISPLLATKARRTARMGTAHGVDTTPNHKLRRKAPMIPPFFGLRNPGTLKFNLNKPRR